MKEEIAKALFDIHCSQLIPFYGSETTEVWADLPEMTVSAEDVDKRFFRQIAQDFIEQREEQAFIEDLPKCLYEIHSNFFPPYYLSTSDYIKFLNDSEDYRFHKNWSTLDEELNDGEKVDKKFFKEIAAFLLAKMKN